MDNYSQGQANILRCERVHLLALVSLVNPKPSLYCHPRTACKQVYKKRSYDPLQVLRVERKRTENAYPREEMVCNVQDSKIVKEYIS